MSRQVPIHVKPEDVDQMYRGLHKARISQTRLAELLGISRTTLHLMFKHELPMRKVYGIAIRSVIEGQNETRQ
jgi:hypothetical protein